MIPPCEVRSQFTGPLPRESGVTPRMIVPAESLAIIGASGAARAWKKRFSTTSAPAPVSLDRKKFTCATDVKHTSDYLISKFGRLRALAISASWVTYSGEVAFDGGPQSVKVALELGRDQAAFDQNVSQSLACCTLKVSPHSKKARLDAGFRPFL